LNLTAPQVKELSEQPPRSNPRSEKTKLRSPMDSWHADSLGKFSPLPGVWSARSRACLALFAIVARAGAGNEKNGAVL